VLFISRIINYQNFAPRFFCRFGVAERPKGKARSLAWEAAEGLTEANPQNDSGLPRPLSQRRPEPAREQRLALRLFEIASVVVRFKHIASSS